MWYFLTLLITLSSFLYSQNLFIVVVDGERYSETFGSKGKYIPNIWNVLRPEGTIYTNFWNVGITKTCPGHGSILTGFWQKIANDGSERCLKPTLFEYFRKQTGVSAESCIIVSGKSKLQSLTYSDVNGFGAANGARFFYGVRSDTKTWEMLVDEMDRHHPRLVMVSFSEVDYRAHEGTWQEYLEAIRQADSIIALLWNKIQADSIYRNMTTLFITNDHGRHDQEHGGFQEHGDSCNGCQHIMFLALGPSIKKGGIVSDAAFQIDLAPTAASILGIKLPPTQGRDLNLKHRKVLKVSH